MAFRFYFDRYARPLCAFIINYCKTAMIAEDIVQECFLNLFTNRQKINDEEHLERYLFRVARHRTANHQSSDENRRHREFAWVEAHDQWDDQQDETEVVRVLVLNKIHQLSKKMPARQRAVFELYFYHEMDVRSIARSQRVKEKTVYNQLQRAYSFLVRQMPDPELLVLLIVLLARRRS
jgi:RNA polymerase sigma factor (sigma-70 family)